MPAGITAFDLIQPDLQTLLKRVESGQIQLPDFQRGWVWREEGIRGLIASITLAYPIGALLMLKTKGAPAFHPRPIQGAPDLGVVPDLLLLDGQQRVTSLYMALRHNEPVETQDEKGKAVRRWFYLDIAKCLDEDVERVDAVLSTPADRIIRTNFSRDMVLDLSTPENQYQQRIIPLEDAFDSQRMIDWHSAFVRHHGGGDDPMVQMEAMQQFMQFQERVLRGLQAYRVPSIELAPETDPVAVCQVFENVNTRGVKLTVFELLTAMFSAQSIRAGDTEKFSLRSDWLGDEKKGVAGRKQRLVDYHALKAVRGRDFLQAVTLLSTYEASLRGEGTTGSHRKDMLKLQLSEYKACADRLESGFLRAAKMLNRLKIFEERNVPYASQLIPLAAILARLGGREESKAVRDKLDQWFWCGVLGELYGSSTETRYAHDIGQVLDWVDGGPEPFTVRDGAFNPTRLLSLRSRNSAAYKGVAALILAHDCRDFARGDSIGDLTYDKDHIDIHHLFPQKWCKAQNIPASDYNGVFNRTPLARRTNQRISGHAPSHYLERLEGDEVSAEQLDSFIRSHLASPELLRADAYQEFKLDRSRRLLDLIERAMGKAIPGRESESVAKDFGGPLPPMPRDSDTPSQVLYDRYTVLQELHGGGMARAYRALDQATKVQVFVKQAWVDNAQNSFALERELAIYTKLERAGVEGTLRILDVHHDPASMALVTELAQGNLEEFVEAEGGSLPPASAKRLGLEVAHALANLHAIGIVHRDIKPGNIMRVGEAWKLGDFGLAKNLVRLHSAQTMRGGWTPGYAPEEQVVGAEPHPSMDVYALGKVITYLLTGGTDPDQLQRPVWRNLLKQATRVAPDERVGLDALIETLEALPC